MRIIYKYELDIASSQPITLPIDRNFLSVQCQDENHLVFWWDINPDSEKEKIEIVIRGTGEPFQHSLNETYLGTVQMPETGMVWHVFI